MLTGTLLKPSERQKR